MQNEISFKENTGFILISTGFLILITSLYFEHTRVKPVMMITGIVLMLAAALNEAITKKRNQTLMETFSLVLILLWGILHIMIW